MQSFGGKITPGIGLKSLCGSLPLFVSKVFPKAIAFLCVIQSFLGLSYTPRGFCSHTIFLVGYLTAYLLYTGFAAGITSILVGKDVHKQISLQQVKMQKITLFSVCYLKGDLKDYVVRASFRGNK